MCVGINEIKLKKEKPVMVPILSYIYVCTLKYTN